MSQHFRYVLAVRILKFVRWLCWGLDGKYCHELFRDASGDAGCVQQATSHLILDHDAAAAWLAKDRETQIRIACARR